MVSQLTADAMMSDLFEILYEDDCLLVINKPAGLVCHPTKGDEHSSLAGRIRLYFGKDRPVHLINRLDRETSGVVVVGKSSEAARQLRQLWVNREVQKKYWAIVHGHVAETEGLIDKPLGKDESSEVAIKDCVQPNGAQAQTRFSTHWQFSRSEGDFTWLEVMPVTGRKHQIRIHLAYIGHPIVGDKLYGVDGSCYLKLVKDELTGADWQKLILRHQALHSYKVRFGWRDQDWEFTAEPPDELVDFIVIVSDREAMEYAD